MVLEIINRKPVFYENELGVLTNSPGFEWQLTNLNNYVNLHAGGAGASDGRHSACGVRRRQRHAGAPGRRYASVAFRACGLLPDHGAAAGHGARRRAAGIQIPTNFDIPIGVEFAAGEIPADIPSATQWTSATDPVNRVIYYRTMYNSAIRSIDLRQIDFSKVAYRSAPLDEVRQQPVHPIRIE